MLRVKDVVIADEKALATLMNNYFVNITADLDLKRDSENFMIHQLVCTTQRKNFKITKVFWKLRKPLR